MAMPLCCFAGARGALQERFNGEGVVSAYRFNGEGVAGAVAFTGAFALDERFGGGFTRLRSTIGRFA